MRIAVDTNVLLRFANPNDSEHLRCRSTINRLLKDGHEVGHTPQARRELWAVATRPATVNGLGADPNEALRMLSVVDSAVTLWDDIPGISAEWQRIVSELSVRGVQVHDANHVAAALCHGVSAILTLDQRDFVRYKPFGIETIATTDT